MKSNWQKLQAFLRALENWLLASLFIVVLVAANTQIVLRNLFDSPVIWIDPMLRVTVLWLALMGAMVATRERTHIAIDALSRYMPLNLCLRMERLIHAFSAMVCGLIAWHSGRLIQIEYLDGFIAFARVPVWLCEAIIPIAFALMALRFLLQALGPRQSHTDRQLLTELVQGKPP